jgi:hypothetical protein
MNRATAKRAARYNELPFLVYVVSFLYYISIPPQTWIVCPVM